MTGSVEPKNLNVTVDNFDVGKDFLYLQQGLNLGDIEFVLKWNEENEDYDTLVNLKGTETTLATLSDSSFIKIEEAAEEVTEPTTINNFNVDRDFFLFADGIDAGDVTVIENEESGNLDIYIERNQKDEEGTTILDEDGNPIKYKTFRIDLENVSLEEFQEKHFEEYIKVERLNLVDGVFNPLPTNPTDTRLATFKYTVPEDVLDRPQSREDDPVTYEIKGTASDHQQAAQEYISIPAHGEPLESEESFVTLNESHNIQWIKQFKASGNTSLITLDNQGHIYLAGGSGDVSLIKYKTDGTPVWNYKKIATSKLEREAGISVDSEGNVYLLSYTYEARSFVYSYYGRLTKYDSDGNLQETRDLGGGNAGGSITIDDQDNIYITRSSGNSFWIDKYNNNRNNLVEFGGHSNESPKPSQKLELSISYLDLEEYDFDNNAVTLKWLSSDHNPPDDKTPLDSLTYNLELGLVSDGEYTMIMSPLSENNNRLISQIGNVGYGNQEETGTRQWTIRDLQSGQTYFWNVQAIDQNGKGSNFDDSQTKNFTVNFLDWNNPEAFTEDIISNEEITLNFHSDFQDDFQEITLVQWADANNDGKLEALLIGKDTNNDGLLRLYTLDESNQLVQWRNYRKILQNGGEFKDIQWADYDNNGYLDITFVGVDGEGKNYTGIFDNNQGKFDFDDPELLGDSDSQYRLARWGDVEGDGDLDLLLVGPKKSQVFAFNQGQTETFTGQIPLGVTPNDILDAFWVDYDNDGDLDIVVNLEYQDSKKGLEFYSTNQENNQGQKQTITFSRVVTPQYEGELVAIIDQPSPNSEEDGTGGLDFLLKGGLNKNPDDLHIYHNLIEINNTKPEAPLNISSQTFGTNVTLNWDEGTDLETPDDALTYNLQVGSNPGSDDILSAKASRNGNILTSHLGNVNHNTSWTLHNLLDGIYYYRVQTIDTAYATSDWSNERSFAIGLLPSDTPDMEKPAAVFVHDISNPDDPEDDYILVQEGEGEVTVTFKLTKQVNEEVTIKYETVDGTAIQGQHYQATKGEITFNPNEQEKEITIGLIDNNIEAQGEDKKRDFFVNITDVSSNNAIIKDFQASITIEDDDKYLPDFQITEFNIDTPDVDSLTWEDQITVTWEDQITVTGKIEEKGKGETQTAPTYGIYLIKEDEKPYLIDDPIGVSIEPINNSQYTVKLNKQPSAKVTIQINPQSAEITTNIKQLEFTPENWDQEQIVTINIPDDREDIQTYITHTIEEENTDDLRYSELTLDYITVQQTIIEDDTTTNLNIVKADPLENYLVYANHAESAQLGGNFIQDEFEANINIPFGTPAGNYYLFLEVDPIYEELESDETNNVHQLDVISITEPTDGRQNIKSIRELYDYQAKNNPSTDLVITSGIFSKSQGSLAAKT